MVCELVSHLWLDLPEYNKYNTITELTSVHAQNNFVVNLMAQHNNRWLQKVTCQMIYLQDSWSDFFFSWWLFKV
jgi:hypothetical protein